MRTDFGRTVGVELEGWALKGGGVSLDVYEYLGGVPQESEWGSLSWELCSTSLEVATRPCRGPEEILACLQGVLCHLPPTWDLFWQPRDPTSWSRVPRLDHLTQRHHQMLNALRQVSGEAWVDVWHSVAQFAATQVSVCVRDLELDVRARVFGALNLLGPQLARRANERCGRSHPSERMRQGWQRFAEPQRLWSYTHKPTSWEELEGIYARVPRLLKQSGGSDWEVDLSTPGTIGDLQHEKHWWGLVRYRSLYETVELRVCDALPPSAIPALIDEVLEVVERAIDGNVAVVTEAEWLADLGRQ